MKQKSLVRNSGILMIKNIIGILASMIIYKYATTRLGVENVGSVEFVKSIISYFLLISMMGVSNVAIRECSKVRGNQAQITKIASEIYGINIVATLISYTLLFIVLIFVERLADYKWLIVIYSASIFMTTFGTEWIFNIYEDFTPLAISTIIVQSLAVLLTVLFINDVHDIYLYTVILTISSTGYELIAHFFARRYVKIRPVIRRESRKYLVPILILFFSSIASKIYTNADVTMLGAMVGDYEVGIYSAAVKIYDVFHVIVSVGITVAVSRATQLMFRQGEDVRLLDKESKSNWINSAETITDDSSVGVNRYGIFLTKVTKAFFIFIIPCALACILYGTDMIVFISGSEFAKAIKPLMILAVILLIATFNMIISNMALVPGGKEKYILISTIVGAISNIALNCFFIPMYGCIGAAITTLISEFLVCLISAFNCKEELRQIKISVKRDVAPLGVGILIVMVVHIAVRKLALSPIVELVAAAIVSITLYCIVFVVMKNDIAIDIWQRAITRIKALRC